MSKRAVQHRARRLLDAIAQHIPDDADDPHPGVGARGAAEPHVSADGIGAPEILPREFLIDDEDRFSLWIIVLHEGPATKETDAHETKVVGGREIDLHRRHLLGRIREPAVHRDGGAAALRVERKTLDHCRGFHPGKRSHPAQHVGEQREPRRMFVVLAGEWVIRLRQPQARGQYVARIDTSVDVLHAPEASQEERRSDQQDHCERELADHERPAEHAAGTRHRRAAILQRIQKIGTGELQGGCEAEQHAGHQRHPACKHHDRGADADFRDARQPWRHQPQ